jgi:phthalate 4,5-cis-dihydrodiol dehydrogenase
VPKDANQYGAARRNLERAANSDQEAAFKNARNYGGADYPKSTAAALSIASDGAGARWHQHFGWVVVSCDRADLRPLPTGVMVYGDAGARMDPLPRPRIQRAEVIDELYGAIVHKRAPLHDGKWAMATLEVCLAVLQSAREQRDITLVHQVAASS